MNQQKFKFIEISQEIDESTFIALESAIPNDVIHALLSIVWYSGDYPMSITCTRKFFKSENEFIKGASIECVGHIARIFGKLPEEFINQVVESLNNDSYYVKSKAEFTLEDLKVFIKGFKRLYNQLRK